MLPSLEEITNAELDRFIQNRDKLGPGFKLTNTNDLMATEFQPLKEVVPGYLYGGFSVLAGRQKLGKTWLAIDWAVAVATGGVAMGSIDCEAGDVLYIDLENGPRRIQSRIKTLFGHCEQLPDLSRLHWVTEAPALDQGFIKRLELWRLSVKQPRFVAIDVLQRIKPPPGNKNQNAYESDYSTWAPLQQWATESGVATLGLHHTKKGGADDPLEALSGSNGLSACADTTIVLDHDQNGRTLYVRGRDVEEKETAVTFVTGQWSIIGNAPDVRRSDARRVILNTLIDNNAPMTPSELTSAIGQAGGNVRQLLMKMAKSGEIYKIKKRYWVKPDYPGNNDNTDNNEDF
jgi:RecA-family ATPase